MVYRIAPAPVSRGKREDKKKMLNSWARAGSKNICFGPVMRRSTSEGFPHKTHQGGLHANVEAGQFDNSGTLR